MLSRLFLIAARNLVQHQRGSLLWGAAAGLVTAVLLVLFGFMHATHEKIYETATLFSSGHLNIAGIFKFSPSRAVWMVEDSRKVEEVVHQVFPDADLVATRMQRLVGMSSRRASIERLYLVGVDPEREERLRRNLRVVAGSLDALVQPGRVVLSRGQAATLSVELGDTVTVSGLTMRGAHNAVDLEVAAVVESMGSFSGLFAFTSLSTLREFSAYPDGAAAIVQVHLKEPLGDLSARKEALARGLEAAGMKARTYGEKLWEEDALRAVEYEAWTGGRLLVGSWEDLLSDQLIMLAIIGVLGGVAGTVLLVLACVGLSVGLGLSVRSRTQEIGTLRAMGMGRGQVVLLFILEGLLLGFCASLAGVALGLVACAGLNLAALPVAQSWQFFIGTGAAARFAAPPEAVLGLVAGMSFCAVLASLFPSLMAARLPPILAMQNSQTGS